MKKFIETVQEKDDLLNYSLDNKWDWNEFLNKEEISQTEWDTANDLASDWVTCACGHQCDIIPRSKMGAPMDPILYELGNDFADSIGLRLVKHSKNILKDIESRSSYLINKIQENG